MTDKPEDSGGGADIEQPFLAHLLELRNRLLHIVYAVVAILIVLMPFANQIYALLAEPLVSRMPQGSTMIAIEVASPFLAPFKLTLVLAVFLAIPYILYQVWAFVAPGLYRHERRLVYPLLISSTALFFIGMLFAYAVVFPLMFGFLATTAPQGVAMMTDINKYLDFMLTMFFAFGIAFQVPVATFILVWMGVTTPDKLAAKRPYIILGAFVIGAILTPPDGVTQTLLAVPMWLLFELGVFFARLFARRRAEAEAAAGDANSGGMSEDEMEAELDRIDAQEHLEQQDTHGTVPKQGD